MFRWLKTLIIIITRLAISVMAGVLMFNTLTKFTYAERGSEIIGGEIIVVILVCCAIWKLTGYLAEFLNGKW